MHSKLKRTSLREIVTAQSPQAQLEDERLILDRVRRPVVDVARDVIEGEQQAVIDVSNLELPGLIELVHFEIITCRAQQHLIDGLPICKNYQQ